jgi:hypothetical protein
MSDHKYPKHRSDSSPSNRVAHHLQDGYAATRGSVTNHPATSMLVAFGVGCAIGVLLGHAFAEPPRDTRSRVTDFGHEMFEAMRSHMPRAWASKVG